MQATTSASRIPLPISHACSPPTTMRSRRSAMRSSAGTSRSASATRSFGRFFPSALPHESIDPMSRTFLPYGRQTIEVDDVDAVVAALRSDFLTTGPLVEAFEKLFAEAVGADHAVACNSGTAALHLAALAVDLGP